ECGGGAEQVDHRTLELMKKDDQSTGFARRHDGVGTKLLQAVSGFLVGKPFTRRHAKACQYPICRQRLWCIRQRFQGFRHTSLAPMRFFVRLGSKIMEIGREELEPSQRGDPSTAMSESGPQRRKSMSAPMSAIGELSGLVMLTVSFDTRDAYATSARSGQNSISPTGSGYSGLIPAN